MSISLSQLTGRLLPRARSTMVAFALASLALAACADGEDGPTSTATPTATSTATSTATPTVTSTGVPTETASPTATATEPGGGDAPDGVDTSRCEGLIPLMRDAFPEAALIGDVTAFEPGGAAPAQGCRVLVTGDGSELPSFVEVAQTLRAVLEDEGWTEDPQFAADGPTGTQSLYERGEEQALVTAGVATKDPEACPADQVISECLEGLEPEELEVSGSIIVRVE